ncbi:Prefoldin subunit-domain-containing protein [Tribonema minus]|uniref:Prefoldin subunit-domain-containing protein n=1 Tax=Tribonema minus TaxID=303371 RepID=A0A835ZFR4_9STRA|nr:Prefoldin subunit-domain-containing protein [Tribonema minus]
MASVVGQREVDLSSLSLEQLNQLKTQHQEEVQTLTANYAALRDGLARYQEAKSAVEAMGRKAEGREILVPLTQSLYVPGKVIEGDKFLVDIGTGYYAEKSQRETEEFLTRKAGMVEANLASLREVIEMKRKAFETLTMVMRQRLSQIEENRSKYMAQQAKEES